MNLEKERNYGVDALRLLAMFFIVTLHLLTQGCIINQASGAPRALALCMEAVVFCAVDCYAIISGFVGYSDEEKPYRYHKFLSFWLQVFCYSFFMTLVGFLIKSPDFTLKVLILSVFPVSNGTYWYVTQYAALFFMIPWLNKLIRACDKKQTEIFVVVLLILFSFFTLFLDPFKTYYGFSFLWLAVLYVVGAWMKKYDIPSKIKPLFAIVGIILCCILLWSLRCFLPSWKGTPLIVCYASPVVTFIAVSYLALFAKLKVNRFFKKTIAFFAPCSFGVYLVHEHPLFLAFLLSGKFAWIATQPVWLVIPEILACSFVIFLVCLLIDRVRHFFFRLLRVDRLIDRLSQAVLKKFKKREVSNETVE
ncbi:MAG: acyltransferase [Clostridia bacterium]|nr:acyltransferase [Clostridia bacterium]